MYKSLDVVIIGAGPIGIAIAARLVFSKRSFIVLEKGESVGANILEWGHVSLFSNWQESVDSKCHKLLNEQASISYALEDFPTGNEFVHQYLQPIANHPLLKNNIQLNSKVHTVSFDNVTNNFTITYHQNKECRMVKSKVVIDASGTWGNYNKLVENYADLFGYACFNIPNSKQITDYFQNATIAIIGNGHSAMNSIALVSQYSNAVIYWILRNDEPNFGNSKVDGKSKKLETEVIHYLKQNRIRLIKNFSLKHIFQVKNQLNLVSEVSKSLTGIDFLIQNIGANADYSFLQNIPLNLEPTLNIPKNLAKKIDPKLHTCNTLKYTFQDTLISEIDYYVVGMKSFGKASNFLLSSGYKILDELVDRLNRVAFTKVNIKYIGDEF